MFTHSKTGMILVAAGLWGVWTLATWSLEGRIETFARPDAVTDRLVYTGVANVAIGIVGGAFALQYLLRRGALSAADAGFGPLARTLLWVPVGLAAGLALYFGQGAPSTDAIVILNGFSQVLVVSIAEIVVCWAVVAGVSASVISDRKWVSIPAAALLASFLFGVYHFAHSAPFNTIGMVGFLMAIGVLTSAFFFVSRDIYATIVFHNFLGVYGVVQALAEREDLAAFAALQWPLVGTAAFALMILAVADRFIVRRPT